MRIEIGAVQLRAELRAETWETLGGDWDVLRGRRLFDTVDLELLVNQGDGERLLAAAAAGQLIITIDEKGNKA